MKKITFTSLLKFAKASWQSSFNRLAFLSLGIFLSFSSLSAADYCQAPITATDGVTSVRLSCQLISAGNYQIKVESDVAMTNFAAGVYCNINGVGGNQVISLPGYSRSTDGKTITVNIPSSSAPNLYTPLYILMPGEKNFTWPAGITWGTCVAQTDFTVPVMGTATLVGSPSYNSANVTFTGTDNVTTPVTNYVLTDAANSITNKVVVVDASGNGTITGLNPATTYNFTVKARDAAFNVSANSASLQVITTVRASDCSGDRGHFGNLTVKKIHYTIQYIGGNIMYTITPFDPARTIDFAEVQTTAGNNSMTIAADGKSATYIKTGLSAGTSVGVMFMYSLDNLPGNEMTADNSLLTNANIIYYKVGDCAVVDTEIPTAFTATKGFVTSGNVELLLNATDNLGIIAYTVSYGSGPTVVTQNGTSGTQKSFVISGLTPSTSYTFSIVAKDASGNAATNTESIIASTTAGLVTAAPTPTIEGSKVQSIFSDAYTPIAGTIDFRPNWGQPTVVANVQIAGNTTMKYSTFNFEGTNLGSDLNLPTLGMTHLHFDAWTEDESSLRFSLINRTGGERGVVRVPVKGVWNSFDIPLSDYTSQTSFPINAVYQFKIDGIGNYPSANSTRTTVYFDNIYFYNGTATALSALSFENGISCYPNPIMNQLTVNAKSEISQVVVRNLLGQNVKSIIVKGLEKTIDLSDVSTGNYFVTVKLANGQLSTQKIVKL